MPGISINGRTRLYGIIGNPVRHSFSPAMHSAAFQEIGYNAVYLPFPLEENQLDHLLDAFRLVGVLGFNVTIPFKEKIIPFLDGLSPSAYLLQSVNTVARENGRWIGYSTDGGGFVRSLKAAEMEMEDKAVVVIGAGGAARAIVYALAEEKIAWLQIVNRTAKKSEALRSMLHNTHPWLQVDISPKMRDSFDILINCTSVGMEDSSSPVSDDVIDRCRQVVDIVYSPPQTTLLKKAESRGMPRQNGLEMLLYQGVEAFEIWTGQTAPIEKMRKTLSAALV